MKKINFVNKPNTDTPVNDKNLNKMQNNIEEAINEIVESGASGGVTFVKYSDGTLIQYFGQSITANENRSAGGLTYYSGSAFVDLPVPFANTNYRASANVIIANMNYFCQSYVAPVSTSKVQVSFASTGQNESRTIDVILIGKWK